MPRPDVRRPAVVPGAAEKAPPRGALVLGATDRGGLTARLRAVAEAAGRGDAPTPCPPAEADLRAAERIAIDYADAGELAQKAQLALRALDGDSPAAWSALAARGIFRGSGAPGKVAFMYTGQGSQYANMLGELRRREPVVADTFDDRRRVMAPPAGGPNTVRTHLRRPGRPRGARAGRSRPAPHGDHPAGGPRRRHGADAPARRVRDHARLRHRPQPGRVRGAHRRRRDVVRGRARGGQRARRRDGEPAHGGPRSDGCRHPRRCPRSRRCSPKSTATSSSRTSTRPARSWSAAPPTAVQEAMTRLQERGRPVDPPAGQPRVPHRDRRGVAEPLRATLRRLVARASPDPGRGECQRRLLPDGAGSRGADRPTARAPGRLAGPVRQRAAHACTRRAHACSSRSDPSAPSRASPPTCSVTTRSSASPPTTPSRATFARSTAPCAGC